ncbi:hypothetical protein VTK56DRAFT_4466 [Thermocarpiscus australiensis]
MKNYMVKYNMTMMVPGGDTVGAYGGWTAGGGHNFLSSAFGHGADQILAFQAVTADGAVSNRTYGVLTSAIVKVYARTPVTSFDWRVAEGATAWTVGGGHEGEGSVGAVLGADDAGD